MSTDTKRRALDEPFSCLGGVCFKSIDLAFEALGAIVGEAKVPSGATIDDLFTIDCDNSFLCHSLERCVQGWYFQLHATLREFFGLAEERISMTTTSRECGENPKRRFANLGRHNGTIFRLREYCKLGLSRRISTLVR